MRSRSFVYISLLVDLSIAVAKFIAAAFTHSSSMVSEGVHSVIDATTQVLLIWGIKRSDRQPDEDRPFGYGRELYFWSFMVSLIIFLLGGCISVYNGLERLHHPADGGSVTWNFAILLIAFVFTSISMASAFKAFNKQRGDTTFWKAIKESKDPSVFIVLLGDLGDMAGIGVAFAGVALSRYTHDTHYDAAASIVIGGIMLAISVLLVRESKSLLMGEAISKKTIKQIIAITEADIAIEKVKKQFSTYMGPDEVILQLNAIFKDDLTTDQITTAIARITAKIQARFPRIRQIFVEPVARG